MTAILSLIGGVKGIIVIALVLALGGYIYVLHRDVTQANTERDTAIVQRDAAASERDKAVLAANTNAATIKQLQADKDAVDTALTDLQKTKDKVKVITVTRENTINSQATTPASTAPAAPVLMTVIQQIQADRKARRGATQ